MNGHPLSIRAGADAQNFQTPPRLLGDGLCLLHGGLRLHRHRLRVEDFFLRDGSVFVQILLSVEIHLPLGQRRLGLRHRSLRLFETRHGGIGVGAFDRQHRLPLPHEVSDLDQHRRNVSGQRQHHMRQPVSVGLHLSRRRDAAYRNYRRLNGLGPDLRQLRRVGGDHHLSWLGLGWLCRGPLGLDIRVWLTAANQAQDDGDSKQWQ